MNLKRKSNWNLGCSLTLVVVLAAIFFFNLWAQNLGKYTLQPGESANFTVNPRTHDVEYYLELILKKNDTNKLKLSGKKVWFEMDSDIFYGVEEQKLFRRNHSENDDEELPNNQKDINLVRDGIVVSYKGEKVFNVTNNKSYTITITNVDDKPAHFEAQVVDR
ncbi:MULTISPECIES: hypothetical protein [Streptococcus]|jgi:hypothetical protein|uniref:Uncharacterized protein n=3 Tax=Bacteria TaxID=2 RepID=A0A1S0ZAD4_SALET|nr:MULTISPECIES: hypothetical protein [Streptococcus]ANR74526.1 hypothetical protein AXF18_00555 [Streptococcus sp. oral taxon 064]ATF56291.1 hypothetical protein CO686_02185 [Streptococcus oralis]MBK3298066.1 hypothetical protein [Streptococcus oralis]MBS9397258.1 hypothetical protein [Streptococcus oralis]MBT3115773.1 hypothetical protein [Streptococcus oralis]